jgi:hypothetical protein
MPDHGSDRPFKTQSIEAGNSYRLFLCRTEPNKLVFQRPYLAVMIMPSESEMNRGKQDRLRRKR